MKLYWQSGAKISLVRSCMCLEMREPASPDKQTERNALWWRTVHTQKARVSKFDVYTHITSTSMPAQSVWLSFVVVHFSHQRVV